MISDSLELILTTSHNNQKYYEKTESACLVYLQRLQESGVFKSLHMLLKGYKIFII